MRLTHFRTRIAGVLGAAAILAISAGTAQAQTRFDRQMTRQVLSRMHHVNQMEIRLGTLAMAKGRTSDVRYFGRQLRDEHIRNDRQVVNLASREGVRLYAIGMNPHERQVSRRLRLARGHEFDREFLNAMARGHTQVIQEMRQAHRDVRDPEVRRFIGNTLPALREHRNMARSFQDQL
jgi:putative membrane protein